MAELLIVHGPKGSQNPISHTRTRMGLPPHTQAFENFIAASKIDDTDITRPMIGCAVSKWQLYPDFDNDE